MIEKILSELAVLQKTNYEAYETATWNNDKIAYINASNAFSNAMAIVQEVARDGGWIPCETELPPEPKENPVFDNKPLELYLVTLQGTEYPFRAFWTGKEFTDGWGKLSYVTAWQPLPPKYEPKLASYQKGE